MKYHVSLLFGLIVAITASAAPIELPSEVRVKPGRLTKIEAKGDAKQIKWINVHEDLDAIPSENGKWLIVSGPSVGRYKLAAYGADSSGPYDPVYVTVVVEGVVPPTPPNPPTPPTPVPPTPPVPPAPIPVTGLRVLIVYDSSKETELPVSQQVILRGKAFDDYLRSKTVMGPDGKTPEYRIWPSATVVTADVEKHWRDAMSLERKSLPWLIVSDGKTGYQGPLPATVDETKAIIDKIKP